MNTKRFFALTLALLMALLLLPPAPARAEDTYPLTVKVSPAGAGTVSGGGGHAPGEEVTLTATANSNYVFDHWECDSAHVGLPHPELNPTTIELYEGYRGATVTAVFEGIPYAVTVTADPAEAGSVSGGGSYPPGDKVTLTATPKEGYKFDGWQVVTGHVTVADDGTFTMPAEAVEVKAVFKELTKWELVVNAWPAEGGTTTGGGLYYVGQIIDITATPNPGWRFKNWMIGGSIWVSPTGNPAATCEILSGYLGGTATARFEKLPTYDLTVQPDDEDHGSVTGAGNYYEGQEVTLTATAKEGWVFDKWEIASGNVTLENASAASTKCTMGTGYEGGSVIAKFKAPPTYAVTVTADPAEGGTVTGGGDYQEGKPVTLTATPNEGYRFKAWSSDDVTVAQDGTFDMPAKAVAVKASFVVQKTVIWTDEEGKELERKTYWADEEEPTTDLKPTKAEDETYTYDFAGWEASETGNVKTYKATFTPVVKPVYTLVSGANPSYRLKSGKTLTFTIKRNVDDENCFTYFEGVTLDGAALAEGTDYTAAPGSTVVTLKPAALDKLKTGDHTLIFSFTDGQAQTSVKIQAAYDDETGVGDNSHMFLWLAVALCGMMGLAVLTVERKRLKQR